MSDRKDQKDLRGRRSVDEIDNARRNRQIGWNDYAQLLKRHPEGARLALEYRPKGGRDRQGRLRELEDNIPLGG